MKIIERYVVSKRKYGKIILNNPYLESHERDTIFRLATFGFDVEAIAPSGVPNSNNPDLIMLGTYWEMKRPEHFNESTIKKRFRKGHKQSGGKIVFDLRDLRYDKITDAADFIIELTKTTRGTRRIMIIISNEKLLDIFK